MKISQCKDLVWLFRLAGWEVNYNEEGRFWRGRNSHLVAEWRGRYDGPPHWFYLAPRAADGQGDWDNSLVEAGWGIDNLLNYIWNHGYHLQTPGFPDCYVWLTGTTEGVKWEVRSIRNDQSRLLLKGGLIDDEEGMAIALAVMEKMAPKEILMDWLEEHFGAISQLSHLTCKK